jgi:hypothetical protein
MTIATNDLGNFAASCAELGPLTGLSLQHTRPGMTPAAPSNEDRARAFRNAQPVALANHFHWPFQHSADGQIPATGSVAMGDEEPGASVQENKTGNRRLSLVQAA